jgi:hypothetical protein
VNAERASNQAGMHSDKHHSRRQGDEVTRSNRHKATSKKGKQRTQASQLRRALNRAITHSTGTANKKCKQIELATNRIRNIISNAVSQAGKSNKYRKQARKGASALA